MADLPEENVEEILCRVPAKSLLSFTTVCEQWSSLISDPNFIRNHLNHVLLDQSHNHHHRLILRSRFNFYFLDCTSNYYEQRDFPLLDPDFLKLFGSSNGLLCIGLGFRNPNFDSIEYCAIVLWNPLSGDYRRLPDSSSFPRDLGILGFGYDSYLDSYKVVRLVTDSLEDGEVEIYTLKTDEWRRIRLPDVPVGVTFRDPFIGTHVDGSIYWIVWQSVENQLYKKIISFDFVDEKVRLVELPHDCYAEMWPIRLMDMVGRLGMYQCRPGFPQAHVWTMKEENGSKFWEKNMSIPHPAGMFCEPVSFMKNGEVLMSVSHLKKIWKSIMNKDSDKERKLALYNPEKGTFRDILSYDDTHWIEDATYVETLVSPNGGCG